MFGLRTLRTVKPCIGARLLSSSRVVYNKPVTKIATTLAEVTNNESLIGPGAKEGTIPTDLDQATGLERLELLGKLEGIEFFDSKPLDASRTGTMKDPIIIDSYDDHRYVGCSGAPADSHEVQWMRLTDKRVSRCWECGSVYKLNKCGVPHEGHH